MDREEGYAERSAQCYEKEIADLKQQNRDLRAALEAIEWVPRLNDFYCPWCENRKAHGHTDDCQRQQALDKVGE